ncbi:MAG: hypothetical protein AAFN07_12815 [Pseudomonadota bacterium]
MRHALVLAVCIAICGCSAAVLECADRVEGSQFQATYVYGVEVDALHPCGESEPSWASYNWEGAELLSFYKSETTRPYQPIYIEFRGAYLAEEMDGFASSYAGLLHILEIEKMSLEVPEACHSAAL